MPRFGSAVDLQRIPIKGLVPESGTSAPTNPVEGQFWTDSQTGRVKVWELGGWQLISQSGNLLLTSTFGGDVSGTYNNLQLGTGVVGADEVADGSLTHVEIAAANKDGAAGTPSMRTLGAGAQQAAAGNHTHTLGSLSDVTVTSPATGNVIRWSGSAWVNAVLVIGDISGLQAALDGKAAASHTHDAADVTTGTFALARIPVAASGASSATQVVRADDSRLSNSRTPSGSAGGDLSGSYPNPTIANLAVTDGKVATANKDGLAVTPSMRTLGPGAQQAMPGNARLDEVAAPTSPVSMNGQRITNLGTPTADGDAASKSYVDAARAGLRIKDAVRVATTANITLSGTQTIDGVAVSAGDRVLVKAQTTASQNGIYVVAAGAWARAADADSAEELGDGATTFVQQGTAQANTTWAQINTLTTLASTQEWVQQGAAANYVAGAGLTQTGTTFDVVAADGSIIVNPDSITVGNVPVSKGGTGATTAANARTNLGALGKYAADLGALTAGSEATITHGLSTTDVQAMFRMTSGGQNEILDWRVIDANSIGVTSHVAYASGALRVVVQG